MSLYQVPPETITVNDLEYPIDTDFRVWTEFQALLTDQGTDREKAERLTAFMDKLGLPASRAALDAMLTFYAAESTEKYTAARRTRSSAFDFRQDSEYIYAAFMGTYNIDLTTARIHWWVFKALFKALPDDCELCKIMRYRTVDLKDVPKDQRRFYQEQKARYSLGKQVKHQTEQDMRDYVERRFRDAQLQMEEQRINRQGGWQRGE